MVTEEFDLSSLIIDCVTTTAPLYRSKDLILDLSVDKNLPRKITGDTYKLRRSIVYLLSFACMIIRLYDISRSQLNYA